MNIKIALAGNPNSGKTTLFNAITGSNQFVGNWPGVTVEKKEGMLKGYKDVTVMDLPGIYSLSPYTLEEVVARNYLLQENPDVILNIVDGTNLERNLYLTTQLCELGVPVVIAINMIDIVRKNKDEINIKKLSEELGCEIVEISALKGTGIYEAAEVAVDKAIERIHFRYLYGCHNAESGCGESEDIVKKYKELHEDLKERYHKHGRRFKHEHSYKHETENKKKIKENGSYTYKENSSLKGKHNLSYKKDDRETNKDNDEFLKELKENQDEYCFYSKHLFSPEIEVVLNEIEGKIEDDIPKNKKRFYAIKLFERDKEIHEQLNKVPDVEDLIEKTEKEFDDDAESIITNERYNYITDITKKVYKKKNAGKLTVSDKIDLVVTNRFLALPIFAIVMFIVYFVSITTVGTWATDWTNDGVFGDGWFLLGRGSEEYENALDDYERADSKIEAYLAAAKESGIDISLVSKTIEEDTLDKKIISNFSKEAEKANISGVAKHVNLDNEEETLKVSNKDFNEALKAKEPNQSDYGIWISGIPVVVENLLEKAGTADWLNGLILDGIIAGVGAVLGFIPQMLVLFAFLAFLEACGYMSRIAFVLDKIFRKFGLSGKSFIPMLIGTGCGIPGIMASRTIENDRDRKITIITTTFIPCSAKLPIIALISGALFGGAWWVAPSAYFIGMAAIVVSGIILKKLKVFSGDPAPFVMELPDYHWPLPSNILRSMWERGWSFIKKAGTVILVSSIIIWFTSNFGFVNGGFGMVNDLSDGILANIGGAISWVFKPLGWGQWQPTVATITGLVAKENVVGTFGVLYGFGEVSEYGVEMWSSLAQSFTILSAYSFLIFNLLCAPCFAAIGAIKREMNNWKWTAFAIGYQTLFAYAIAFCVYQLGSLFTTGVFNVFTGIALLVVAFIIYLLARPNSNKEKNRLQKVAA